MNVLTFDTETTGLVNHKLAGTDPKQPMPVQLGMKLDGLERKEVGLANLMIKTHGKWKVDSRASAVTGITNELADAYGTELISAYEVFLDYAEAADVIVAHNATFDVKVMQRAGVVYAEQTGTEYKDPFENKKIICTMRATIDVLKLTPKRFGEWKWPSLEECMQNFFGETIVGAHDALVDVKATARVFYHLVDTGVFSNG